MNLYGLYDIPESVKDAKEEQKQLSTTLLVLSSLLYDTVRTHDAKPGKPMLSMSEEQFREWKTWTEHTWLEYEARILFLTMWIEQTILNQQRDI